MNNVDLHTHSLYSDGTFTPDEIVKYANEKGLRAIALTDHDTLSGINEAKTAGEKYGVEIIPGIEVSTEYDETEIHIVGLFVNENTEFNNALKELRESREKRNIQMVEKLNRETDIKIKYEDVLKRVEGGIVTRAHIAREIIDKGYASSNNEVFEKYIGKGKPGYVKRSVMDWRDTLKYIICSGGLPVLAHPLLYKISSKYLEKIIEELAEKGLAAVEAYYSTHSPSDVKYVKSLCVKYGLKISGGSDFHGSNKPKIDLGTGYGNLCVPYSVLEGLKEECEKRRGA
ncbi:MAG: PHP domain-containing protein [Clostridia bacterium]|nr:PHP domain-containing protein [Clostridia bacterium]